jgi:hypothetical protein
MFKGATAGTFIVRESSQAGSYVLSVRAPSGVVLNARLIPVAAGRAPPKYRLGEEGEQLYESIPMLVELFTVEAHLVDKVDGKKFKLHSEAAVVEQARCSLLFLAVG